MKALLTGIYSKFTAGGTFYTNMGGRLYLHKAPEESTYPFCVFSLISNEPDYYLGGSKNEVYTIQFSIFDDDNSASDITTYATNLMSMYDDTVLTISGGSHIKFERETNRLLYDDKFEIWQYIVQYEGMYK